jgi:hypothetical protein
MKLAAVCVEVQSSYTCVRDVKREVFQHLERELEFPSIFSFSFFFLSRTKVSQGFGTISPLKPSWMCRSCLDIANQEQYSIKHIAFPAVSCGVYKYPLAEAAQVALEACKNHCGSLASITFVLFSESTAKPFLQCADAMFAGDSGHQAQT